MKKMNLFIIHSLYGNTRDSFAESIKKLCFENNIDYYFLEFPTGENANCEDWEKILDQYYDQGFIHQNTIMIGHSLGADFVPIYLNKKGVSILSFISVAGFLVYDGDNEQILSTKKKFNLSMDILGKVKDFALYRYSIYSDNVPISSIERLKEYAKLLDSTLVLIPGGGHFGPKSNVFEIEELDKIILSLINK